VLGLVIATAVGTGGGWSTTLLFLTYAFGAAVSLLLVLTAGGRLLALLRRTRHADRWLRPMLGVLTLGSVLVVASGWDRVLYARVADRTSGAETTLLRLVASDDGGTATRSTAIGESVDDFAKRRKGPSLTDEGEMPELAGAVA
jgi:hypothetical protein